MVHFDIKTLRNLNEKGVRNEDAEKPTQISEQVDGIKCMHLAIDDHSHFATVSVVEDETAESVTKHLVETYQ